MAVIAIQALAPMAVQAAATVDLDQWASSDKTWQNGNLNGNNSRYPEGGIVPFRLAIEGLKAGEHRLHINYDVTAGGHKAYDFLATWNVTNARGAICDKGGGARSSMCPGLPSPSSFAFPTDNTKLNGLSVKGAQAYSGAPRKLTIWGGTILGIGAVQHAGSPNRNSTGDMLVRFRSTGSAVLLAWGGHLAQSDYWDVAGGGGPDGAALVSGAPWHMRTLQLDGAGNKNQDRSIQPSAIVGTLPPQALAPTPRPTATPAPRAPVATPRPTPRSTPQAPGPTARPPADPGGDSPGGGSGTGAPQGPAGPVASPGPGLTPPATSTVSAAAARTADPWSVLAAGVAIVAAGALAAGFALTSRSRRHRTSRRR